MRLYSRPWRYTRFLLSSDDSLQLTFNLNDTFSASKIDTWIQTTFFELYWYCEQLHVLLIQIDLGKRGCTFILFITISDAGKQHTFQVL